ncbi:MAG: hypothetical protein ABSG76_27815 [Xanthobacteraceae bacterium]
MGLNDGGIGRRPAAARISANEVWLRALTTTRAVAADPNRILSAVVDAHAEQNGDATALVSDGESLSYRARVIRFACSCPIDRNSWRVGWESPKSELSFHC